jgi:hypothetical protein
VPELWFVAGLALGVAVTGFSAIGSFARGSDSVRRSSWATEHSARTQADLVARSPGGVATQPTADGALTKAS